VTEKLTLATATGAPFAALALHVGTGLVAFVAGFVAMGARKGGTWHRRAGLAFVYAMIVTGIMATGISAFEGKQTWSGGIVVVYLVFTAFTAVRPLRDGGRHVDFGLMVLAFALSASNYYGGFVALRMPGLILEGAPAGMLFFLGTVLLLAAIGDVRLVMAGGVQGSRRIARHLWRMSFGLFIASGSFVLGQMKFIPKPIRIVPLLLVVAVSPLVLLLYWMWRVRLRQNLRGLITRPTPPLAPKPIHP
jgi:hypothetical protein